jgi:hypothetical protein
LPTRHTARRRNSNRQKRSVEARVLGIVDEEAQLVLGEAALNTRRTEESKKLCLVRWSSIKVLCRGCGGLIDTATTVISIAVGRAAREPPLPSVELPPEVPPPP